MKFPPLVVRYRAPKMLVGHRGRVWQQSIVILPDDTTQVCYFDSRWGKCFYFKMDDVWYKGEIDMYQTSNGFDLRQKTFS